MQRRNVEQNKRKTRKTVIRRRIFAGAVLLGSLILICIGFAWFSRGKREAETAPMNVMKPYNLYLMDLAETDMLELSIGNLLLGETKQIVFSVSNGDDNKNFDIEYELQLIYTSNLDLNYTIYELVETDKENGSFITEDTEGNISYWKVGNNYTPLTGTDISAEKHEKLGLTGSEVNSGTYILYENENNNLKLPAGEEGNASQHFLMEIKWKNSEYTDFDKYDKETDMIYIMVKAVQPEPKEN